MAAESQCLFCRIVQKFEPAWIVWEDSAHIAFLTPFPNTPGVTVVATKMHRPSQVFELADDEYHALCGAARLVARILERALCVARTALIAEGLGIDHAHLKLFPLHGVPYDRWVPINSDIKEFHSQYQGYVSSHDGPRASDEELCRMANIIQKAGQRGA